MFGCSSWRRMLISLMDVKGNPLDGITLICFSATISCELCHRGTQHGSSGADGAIRKCRIRCNSMLKQQRVPFVHGSVNRAIRAFTKPIKLLKVRHGAAIVLQTHSEL